MKEKDSILKAGGVSYVLPFILITTCFALWGFANDITNPMVKEFSKIFRMSVTQGSLVLCCSFRPNLSVSMAFSLSHIS